MIKNDVDEEEEFHDSETEPSFCEEADFASKFGNLSISKSDKKNDLTIYAVQFSNKSKINGDLVLNNNSSVSTTNNRLFLNKENAMKLCKEDPDNRRFKPFKITDYGEAYSFSYESSEIESGHAPSLKQIQASLSLTITMQNRTVVTKGSNSSPLKQASTPNSSGGSSSTQDAERLPFPAPKKPEVNQLRSFIEQNMFEQFRDKVVANPRFLISAGDAPVAVQVTFYDLLIKLL
jgi:hypothetical protein